jgi:transposase
MRPFRLPTPRSPCARRCTHDIPIIEMRPESVRILRAGTDRAHPKSVRPGRARVATPAPLSSLVLSAGWRPTRERCLLRFEIGVVRLIAIDRPSARWMDTGPWRSHSFPDAPWARVHPLLPPPRARPRGGRPPVDDRPALMGILFVLAHRHRLGVPAPRDGCGSGMTCWRRLRDWQLAMAPKVFAVSSLTGTTGRPTMVVWWGPWRLIHSLDSSSRMRRYPSTAAAFARSAERVLSSTRTCTTTNATPLPGPGRALSATTPVGW